MALPSDLAPMLATAGPLPADDGRWAYEVKWDGVRALVRLERGSVALRSRAGNDVTASYPELSAVSCGVDALLDGEVVALDALGRPDFGLLQSRMHVGRPSAALLARTPVVLLVFDVLHLGRTSQLGLPYDERRAALGALALVGAAVPPSFASDGAGVLASTVEQGLEGVVAKRRDSPYLPGRRSGCWVKVKNASRQSAVVIGWKPGTGGRSGQLGSLLLAVWTPAGLVFAGHVGTGFTSAVLAHLGRLLTPLAVDAPPCEVPREHARVAHFVRPLLVVDVEYTAWTAEGRLRHPSYKGLRDDLGVTDTVRS